MTWAYVSVPVLLHAALLWWAFRMLPRERWMMLAAIPVRWLGPGQWHCVNLTYYGLFSALGAAAGMMLALFLAGAGGQSVWAVGTALTLVMMVSIPASRWMNRLVEGHDSGFTIGGAAFIGVLAAPWAAWLAARWWAPTASAWDGAAWILGALAPAYALGEGIGRLGCISFGCCYGRRLADMPIWMQRLFARWSFVFEGPLKKAQTEHGWGGIPLVPVQGLTAIISSVAGWTGTLLFLRGQPMAAAVVAMATTQGWRFFSEFLRADYRGGGRISAYQWMALAGLVYLLVLAGLWPVAGSGAPPVRAGLHLLAHPLALPFIAGWSLLIFLRMGTSTVTCATVQFQKEKACHEV
jgi:prolipoprotein diacylglyceryltransferase